MKIKQIKIAAEKVFYILVYPDGTEARSNGGLIVFRTQKEAEDWVQYMLCEVGK